VTSAELPLATAGATSPKGFRRRLPGWFSLRVFAGSLVSGFILGAVLVAVAWTAFGAEVVSPPRDVQLVIPRGTAALLAAGRPTAIPAQISLVAGDTLVLINEDVVTHTLGGWSVSPGSSLRILTDSPVASVFACSIHKSGSLGLIVTPRPGLVDGILLTILVSVPIGLVLFAGATVFRNLDMEPEVA
jgi:hypothetical protein